MSDVQRCAEMHVHRCLDDKTVVVYRAALGEFRHGAWRYAHMAFFVSADACRAACVAWDMRGEGPSDG